MRQVAKNGKMLKASNINNATGLSQTGRVSTSAPEKITGEKISFTSPRRAVSDVFQMDSSNNGGTGSNSILLNQILTGSKTATMTQRKPMRDTLMSTVLRTNSTIESVKRMIPRLSQFHRCTQLQVSINMFGREYGLMGHLNKLKMTTLEIQQLTITNIMAVTDHLLSGTIPQPKKAILLPMMNKMALADGLKAERITMLKLGQPFHG
jgi:hypothetical protein